MCEGVRWVGGCGKGEEECRMTVGGCVSVCV